MKHEAVGKQIALVDRSGRVCFAIGTQSAKAARDAVLVMDVATMLARNDSDGHEALRIKLLKRLSDAAYQAAEDLMTARGITPDFVNAIADAAIATARQG